MALVHSPSIVTSGLALALDAANSKSYPGSGTTWNDLSGNGKNGIFSVAPTVTNNAITFSPAIATMGSAGNTDINMYSCEFWINLPSTVTSGSAPTNFFNYDTNSQGYCTFGAATSFVTGETLTFVSYISSVYYRTAIKDSINAGWNHIVFNWEAANYQFYINNSPKTMYNGDGGAYAHVPLIYLNNFFINYAGDISSVKVYNRTLTAAEITQNFNALRGRYGL
jgi:hypothetical protein